MVLFLVYAVMSYYLIQRVFPHSFLAEREMMGVVERVFIAISWLPLLLLALLYSLVVHFYNIVTHRKDF